MIYFRQTVISQIKSASNEKEINNVVNDSIKRLQIKNVNGHLIERFITSMAMALVRSKQEATADNIKHNFEFALELFRKMQR